MKKNWAASTLGRTLFPPAEAIPQSLGVAFMRMMMAHAKFESEQPGNRWAADKRPKLMVELIEEKLGQIPETEAIEQLLQDAFRPDQRNHLAHGIWWAFDPRTASIHVRGGAVYSEEEEDQFGEYSEETISAIADRFETLEADLYKLRRDIEKRRGDDHDFDWSPPPCSEGGAPI